MNPIKNSATQMSESFTKSAQNDVPINKEEYIINKFLYFFLL